MDEEKKEGLNIVTELRENEGKLSFKDIVPRFIASTAKYGPAFLEMWQTLKSMYQLEFINSILKYVFDKVDKSIDDGVHLLSKFYKDFLSVST